MFETAEKVLYLSGARPGATPRQEIMSMIKLKADYTVMGMEFAENLLLISRASSDAYEPYVFLKGHSEKSSNPDGQNDLL